MKNEKENKKEQLKELYSKFKSAWADPRKKAGIKLLGYLIFFIILLLFASITSHMNKYTSSNTKTTTTTTVQDKYNDKQKKLLTNKYSINYVININNIEYKINGNIENNIINGYFETPNGIKKIVFKENNLYEVNNEQEILLETEINKNLIDLEYILNLIKQNSAIISDKEETKTYTYNIDNLGLNIIVTTNEENISQINIKELINTYILNFDI